MTCEEWPILWPCDENGDPVEPAGDPDQIEVAVQTAQSILSAYTSHTLGICTVVTEAVFDTPADCGPRSPAQRRIVLRRRPVQSVLEVVAGSGAVAEWDLTGSVLTAYTTAANLQVSYRAGHDLGTLDSPTQLTGIAASAMGELAAEILKGMCGGKCALPSRASTIARAGVTVNTIEPERFVELDLLGLKLCDRLIRAVNPNGLRVQSMTMSPDAMPA